MDLSASTQWWLVAGTLVAAELASGTFYLLMLSVGAAFAALAAHAGMSFQVQLIAAAATGGGAVAAWHLLRGRRPPSPAPQSNPDLNLDIGSTVQVRQWRENGTARVHYRGTEWDARHAGSTSPQPGPHVIRAIEGTHLVLERAPG